MLRVSLRSSWLVMADLVASQKGGMGLGEWGVVFAGAPHLTPEGGVEERCARIC